MPKKLVIISVLVWLAIVGGGLSFVWRYENTPGTAPSVPQQWPQSTRLVLDTRVPTLVMAIHPHCPCSRATIGELALLMSSSQGLVKVHVLFVRPAEFDSGWEQTDLWRSAAMIPGVDVSVDEQGQEAFRFGSQTSGQTFLYSPQGNLLFSGGITGARGHSGDNDGRSAILSLLTTGKAERPETPVFGCPLGQETLRNQTEQSCEAFHLN